MQELSRQHIYRRMRSFTSVSELKRWWDSDAGFDAKTDAQIVAYKDTIKATLK